METLKALGIYREPANSPAREDDDALILKAVMGELDGLRIRTELMTPEQADSADLSSWDLIAPMCESYPRLMRLKHLPPPSRGGPLLLNPPDAVLSCYRTRMVEAFSKDPAVRFPPTQVFQASAPGPLAPTAFAAPAGFWVKRGDVHNTCSHDVVFARDAGEAESIRMDFAQREISHLVLQQHIDGDLIKFYGVGPGQWFTWFYHDAQTARRIPFVIDHLAALAARGAGALGLEIFGGDAIVSPSGSVTLIDVNSWPSFAKVRGEAGRQIAWKLSSRLRLLRGNAARE